MARVRTILADREFESFVGGHFLEFVTANWLNMMAKKKLPNAMMAARIRRKARKKNDGDKQNLSAASDRPTEQAMATRHMVATNEALVVEVVDGKHRSN